MNIGKLKKSDQFCIYLRKSRADAEAEKLGEGETLARHERILTELAVKLGLPIGKIYRELVSGNLSRRSYKIISWKPRGCTNHHGLPTVFQ